MRWSTREALSVCAEGIGRADSFTKIRSAAACCRIKGKSDEVDFRLEVRQAYSLKL